MLRTGERENHLVEGGCETVSVIDSREESKQEQVRHRLCRMGMGRRMSDDQDSRILEGRYGRRADQDVRGQAE